MSFISYAYYPSYYPLHFPASSDICDCIFFNNYVCYIVDRLDFIAFLCESVEFCYGGQVTCRSASLVKAWL